MSSGSEGGEAVESRTGLVFQQGQTNLNYKVGCFPCTGDGENCAIICIAELGGRLIVAVPGAVWHRKLARRKLDRAHLGKPLFVDVVGAYSGEIDVPAPEIQLKAWVGILGMGSEHLVEYPCSSDVTYDFGEGMLPYGPALVKLADDQFAFTTAESGGATSDRLGAKPKASTAAKAKSGLAGWTKGPWRQLEGPVSAKPRSWRWHGSPRRAASRSSDIRTCSRNLWRSWASRWWKAVPSRMQCYSSQR